MCFWIKAASHLAVTLTGLSVVLKPCKEEDMRVKFAYMQAAPSPPPPANVLVKKVVQSPQKKYVYG